jgi:diguanylate cyclase (GGDEF)-like protein/PAS domain S-box-containing protein
VESSDARAVADDLHAVEGIAAIAHLDVLSVEMIKCSVPGVDVSAQHDAPRQTRLGDPTQEQTHDARSGHVADASLPGSARTATIQLPADQSLVGVVQLTTTLAERGSALLDAILSALPVGVSVQDEEGRLVILNEPAALAIGENVDRLRNSIPFGVGGADADLFSLRRQRFLEHVSRGEEKLRERVIAIDGQPHTLLVTGKPIQVNGRTMLVSTSIDITERKRFEEELRFRSFHDQLTGLPNRTLIRELVESAILAHSRGGVFALAFIDLDNFKSINDFYNHAIGDALLCAVAERISGQMRPGDTLARIGGDEFLLLVNPIDDQDQLSRVIDRVVTAVKEPFSIDGNELLTSATVGASIFPMHGQSYDTLRRCADNAMHQAKADRKGSTRYFDLAMGDALTASTDMEQRLRTAVREGHIRTAFQPKVGIGRGDIVGFEALARWVDSSGEVASPSKFIALASELGIIDSITNFVLDDVISCLPHLRRHFGSDISVSINIAARQAGDVAFMNSLIDRLRAEGIADAIVLELTEEALVAAQRFERRVLPRLRAIGVRVSIDDFGTGYSSLSTLADITVDEVKVDRAFITSIHERPRSQGILRAIESLCQALNIDVVAEGVETVLELDYLADKTSIRLVQGYYYSRPQYIEALIPDWRLSRPPARDASP